MWAECAEQVFGYDAKLASPRTLIDFTGAGFVVDLSPDRTTALAQNQDLKNTGWWSSGSVAFFFEFSTYNPGTHLHMSATIAFEQDTAGGWHHTPVFRVVDMYRYGKFMDGTIRFFLDLVVNAFVVFFLLVELFQMFFEPNINNILPKSVADIAAKLEAGPGVKRDDDLPDLPYWQKPLLYWKKLLNGWDLLHIGNVAVFLTVLMMDLEWFATPEVRDFSYLPADKSAGVYVNLYPMAYFLRVRTQVTAFNLLLSFMKLFKYFKLNLKWNMLVLTIKHAQSFLAGFMVILFLTFFGLSAMAYFVFGTTIYSYLYVNCALGSLLAALRGELNMAAMEERNELAACIFLFTFMVIIFFVTLNLFIAILQNSFRDLQNFMKAESHFMKKLQLAKEDRRTFLAIFCGDCSQDLAHKYCESDSGDEAEQEELNLDGVTGAEGDMSGMYGMDGSESDVKLKIQ